MTDRSFFVSVPLLCLVPIATTLAPSLARADGEDAQGEAAARAIFEQADQLMANKRFAEACPKIADALKLAPKALGARLTLAECYESLGKLASAWTTYAQTEAAARAAGRADRAQLAHDKAAALRPRLAWLSITVSPTLSTLAGLEVLRDGLVVGKAQWGLALPVDPGEHAVVATAPGKEAWSGTAKVAGEGSRVALAVPPLRDLAAGGSAGVTTAPGPLAAHAPQAPAKSSPRTAGLSLAAGGVVGLGAGVALILVAKSKYAGATSSGDCNASNVCSQPGLDTQTSARAEGTAATVLFAVGAAALVGGGTLWLTAPSATRERAKPASAWAVGLAPSGLLARGSW